jgi:hypothetical protein
VRRQKERLRIVPQRLWDAVKACQQSIEAMTFKLRGVLAHKERRMRHVLSGLLSCKRQVARGLHGDPRDRARTTLKGLIGEIRLIPEGECLTAEFELEGGRLLAAVDIKISVVAGGRFVNFRLSLN